MIDSKLLQSLEWRSVGPHRGGRVVAVAGDPTKPMVFYFGACAGGVWKTTDGGTNWENVSDGFFKTAAVGAIQVSVADSNVIYVGTGETCIRGNVSHGDGVYKSTDAGKTWTNVGLSDTRHIAKIQVHPQNADLVYVAALGHAWGPNKERGVFRSKDGGQHWEQILFRSEQAGAIDLSLDPHNPRVLYVAFWEAQRHPYKLNSGGPDSSLYKTTDGGDTWTEITRNPGLPKGVLGKMGIVASPAKTDRVYAIVEAEDGALFRSDDGGATWTRGSEEPGLRGRPWYYMHVFADPQDADTCYVLDYSMWKSVDAGITFVEIPTPHGDNHGLWIDTHDPKRMIEGNDGGACVSFNGGDSWSTLYNQPTAQFYHVITDNQTPYRIYGSQQDNTAITIPSQSSRGVIGHTDWWEPGGGESGYIAIQPDDPNVVVAGAIGSGNGNGRLIHYNRRTGQERIISVWPEPYGMGVGAVEHKYRFQWTFPIFFSRWEPNALYVAGNRVFRSTNEGHNWEVVSPDITRNDPDKLQPSGGPISKDNTGAETYCIIFALVESPHEKGVMWAGTDDGLVHLSRDSGATWENITPQDLPDWALISIIEPSPHDKATAYLAATRYKHDDTKPYLFKTNDYGQTWTPITNGLPATEFTRVIRADPQRRGLLYAGTESGVWISFDDGANWQRFQNNLPIAPIHDLHIKDTNLIAATHGRSFWVLDDLTPLHQIADGRRQTADGGLENAVAHLFKPRTTTRYKVYKGYGMKPGTGVAYRMAGPIVFSYRQIETPTGEKKEKLLDVGENPPDGAIVHYLLKDKPEGDITLTFMDTKGNEVKSFTSKEKEKPAGDAAAAADPLTPAGSADEEPRLSKNAGANRFVWNMRYADATKLPNNKGRAGTEGLLAGPVAAPGTYQVQLKVGDQTYTQSFEIVKDPRIAASDADLQTQFDTLIQVRNKVSEIHETVLQIRDMRAQADGWAARVDKQPSAQAIKDAAKALRDALTAIEEELVQVKAEDPRSFPSKLNSRMAGVAGFVDSADSVPTVQVCELFDDLSARVAKQQTRLQGVFSGDLAEFNQLCRSAGLDAIVVKPKSDGKMTS